MKRGQVYLVVVLIIAVVALTIAGIYRSSDGVLTGSVIDERLGERIERVEEVCELEEPFDCSVWDIDLNKGELFFRIENVGFENYVIKNLEIDGCDSLHSAVEIFRNSAKSVGIDCELSEGQLFVGEISVFYKNLKGGLSEISEGRLIYAVEEKV